MPGPTPTKPIDNSSASLFELVVLSSFLSSFTVVMIYDLNEAQNDPNTYNDVDNGEYFARFCDRCEISIPDGGQRDNGKIDRVQPTPAFEEMVSDVPIPRITAEVKSKSLYSLSFQKESKVLKNITSQMYAKSLGYGLFIKNP